MLSILNETIQKIEPLYSRKEAEKEVVASLEVETYGVRTWVVRISGRN